MSLLRHTFYAETLNAELVSNELDSTTSDGTI